MPLLLCDLKGFQEGADPEQEQNEVVGVASFTITSNDLLRKILILISTTMGSASLELLITIQEMFPPNKNDDAEVKAETVP